MSGGHRRRNASSRRELLLGLGGWVAGAAVAAPLREGPPLPDPDFHGLLRSDPFRVGVRPCRSGGIRLGLREEPLAGGQALIHAYGHGGAGITLAFGTAERVAVEVERAFRRRGGPGAVAVLGTGVVGLASATVIRERWPATPLTVYAADLDLRSTTSWVAGGRFEPTALWGEYASSSERLAELQDLLARSHDRLMRLDADRFGVARRDNYVVGGRDGAPGSERVGELPFLRLRSEGHVFRTWLVNPTILLPALRDDLARSGVRFVERRFASPGEVGALAEPVVVNGTGFGARALFGDDRVVAERGHLVALERTDPRLDWFLDGTGSEGAPCYVFCRHHDVVVGGTRVVGDPDPAIRADDRPVFDRVLANAVGLFAGAAPP